jgi:SAM-dependent methyltransferase
MIDRDITKAVSDRYARAAATGEQMCCPTGYDFEDLRGFIPEDVLRISYGCGTPAGLDTVGPGETVLDIGSGGGIDCFVAARRVGPAGRVIGLDMTETMLEIARRHAPIVAENLGYASSNVEFRKGMAEAMPVEDNSIDLVISNCVINLAPDKRKVFREMFRVIRPGGRFTISDIVADQPVPQYLIHDTEKWGDCLSGALTVRDYMAGLTEAGFRGVHQVKFAPWRDIDGIHFVSLTLTGYKLPQMSEPNGVRYATLRGPFSRVLDEHGCTYRRGEPVAIDATTADLFKAPPFRDLFILSDEPVRMTTGDPRFTAILPEQKPCVWQGCFAILTGPFTEAEDDDHHLFQRGVPLEVCSKTLRVLSEEAYSRHFLVINRAQAAVSGDEVSCDPDRGCC